MSGPHIEMNSVLHCGHALTRYMTEAKPRVDYAIGPRDTGAATVTHRIKRVVILWNKGQPVSIGAAWLCCGGSSQARLLKDIPPGRPLCRACGSEDLALGPFVYFAERDGLIKIGHSAHPSRRVFGLHAALLAVTPGTRAAEAAMHERFAASRIDGEWFRPTPDLLAHIASLKAVA